MAKNLSMSDFVKGNCEAIGDKNEFVRRWLQTEGDPCSVCHLDRSKCPFFNSTNGDAPR